MRTNAHVVISKEYRFDFNGEGYQLSCIIPQGVKGRVSNEKPRQKDGVTYHYVLYDCEYLHSVDGFGGWLPETILQESNG